VLPEDLEPLLRAQVDPHLPCLHLLLDGRDHRLGALEPVPQQPVLPAQRKDPPAPHASQARRGPLQARRTDRLAAAASPFGPAAGARREPASGGGSGVLPVVVQGAHRDPGQPGQLAHRPAHRPSSPDRDEGTA
jgi:hypothetical protein